MDFEAYDENSCRGHNKFQQFPHKLKNFPQNVLFYYVNVYSKNVKYNIKITCKNVRHKYVL